MADAVTPRPPRPADGGESEPTTQSYIRGWEDARRGRPYHPGTDDAAIAAAYGNGYETARLATLDDEPEAARRGPEEGADGE